MVEQDDAKELTRLRDLLGDLHILQRRSGLSAGVVVREDDRRRAEVHRRAKDLPGIDHSIAITAPGEGEHRDGTECPVEIKAVEFFGVERSKARLEDRQGVIRTADRGIGGGM